MQLGESDNISNTMMKKDLYSDEIIEWYDIKNYDR